MTDITELFSRDPLDLSRQDIETIIAKFRESRKAFNLGNKRAGSTKPPTAKQKKTSALLDRLKQADVKISI
jgi:hypothetical protein